MLASCIFGSLFGGAVMMTVMPILFLLNIHNEVMMFVNDNFRIFISMAFLLGCWINYIVILKPSVKDI